MKTLASRALPNHASEVKGLGLKLRRPGVEAVKLVVHVVLWIELGRGLQKPGVIQISGLTGLLAELEGCLYGARLA